MTELHTVLDRARPILERAGVRVASARAVRIEGGRNNQAYRVDSDHGPTVLLKAYYHSTSDTRDRLGTEWAFLEFCARSGIRCVPAPLAAAPDAHLAVYEFLEGQPLASGDADAGSVGEAFDFWEALQDARHTPDARALPAASEAATSPAVHIAHLERRLRALSELPGEDAVDIEARAFVAELLLPTWRRVRARLEADVASEGRALGDPPPEGLRLSPSDFGFHNALRVPGRGLCFLDFEYAGWDDPAKTVVDFFSQEAVPVPDSLLDEVLDRVATHARDPARERRRIRRAFPACRIAWCCIYLNEFRADSWRRRRFAGTSDEDRAARKRGQLAKARGMHELVVHSMEEHES